jgi:hypothetical protein
LIAFAPRFHRKAGNASYSPFRVIFFASLRRARIALSLASLGAKED